MGWDKVVETAEERIEKRTVNWGLRISFYMAVTTGTLWFSQFTIEKIDWITKRFLDTASPAANGVIAAVTVIIFLVGLLGPLVYIVSRALRYRRKP